jgi:hypothetical protein
MGVRRVDTNLGTIVPFVDELKGQTISFESFPQSAPNFLNSTARVETTRRDKHPLDLQTTYNYKEISREILRFKLRLGPFSKWKIKTFEKLVPLFQRRIFQ